MHDIIQLLPDAVASQIAAGEVIQRPASAVKELLENSIDAGSNKIKLYLKDAGKTLIQVSDDGIGMSEFDARICFERHATSKIRSVDDLFTLHTMGFRGEALASVAAIAQVEMKTKRARDETGTQIIIEGSQVIDQQMCVCSTGTVISIKNLFYNVPARRNFLKSNAVETRHIIEEFIRTSLANPHIAFTLVHNDTTVYDLRSGNFRQRIAALFGNIYNERLVPVEEETSIVRIRGFAGKPEFAKKVRGEQYFFVNNRFIKDPYLNHAVTAAFENLISKDSYPSYFILIDIDPSRIDVNIHPTKTEIKFEDEKPVYSILRAAVKRALGRFSVAPAIDFDQERSFDIPLEKLNERPVQPSIRITPGYNPFHSQQPSTQFPSSLHREKVEQMLHLHRDTLPPAALSSFTGFAQPVDITSLPESSFVQIYNQYILMISSDILLIDQHRAHERILYEKFSDAAGNRAAVTQQQLFPQPLEFTVNESVMLNDLLPALRQTGFDISPFGANTFVIHGAPEEVAVGSEKDLLLAILDQYLHHRDQLHLDSRQETALAMARQLAVKKGQKLTHKEMKELVTALFECRQQLTPSGKTIIVNLTIEKMMQLFNDNDQAKAVIYKSGF